MNEKERALAERASGVMKEISELLTANGMQLVYITYIDQKAPNGMGFAVPKDKLEFLKPSNMGLISAEVLTRTQVARGDTVGESLKGFMTGFSGGIGSSINFRFIKL